MRKNLKIGPAVLIFLGVIFLLNNFGILPWNLWTDLWKFWPVIIILIGIEALIGYSVSFRTLLALLILIFLIPVFVTLNPLTRNPFANEKVFISEPIGGFTRAKVIIDLAATYLNLGPAATDSARLIEGEISFSKAAAKPKIEKTQDLSRVTFTIDEEEQKSPLPFIPSLKNRTDLKLTHQIPLEIYLKTGASSANLDLKELRVDYLEIDSKASNLKIIFGDNYSARAVFKTGTSNIEIQIPKNLAARIKIDSKIKNLSIDSRFENKDGKYETKNFDKAFTRLDVEINALAGSIAIK